MTSGGFGLFSRIATDGLRATVEALYPVNDYGAPDWQATEMVSRTLDYWSDLPQRQRRLLMALFVLIELGAVFFVFGLKRFSRLSVTRRERAVRDLRRSRLVPLRLVGDSLKASTTVIYMSHPAVLEHIGMYSVCDRPEDPLRVQVRADALSRMGESA